jgi:DNA-binding LacI/PurR family transcriptional regulator
VDARTVETCAELRLAGVISLHIHGDALEYLHEQLLRYGIPLAVADSSFAQKWGIRVFTDDAIGVKEALQHLFDLGHRRIGFIAGGEHNGVTALREAAFRQFAESNQLFFPEGYLVRGDWAIEQTKAVTREILGHPQGRPTALLCDGDEMALCAMGIAHQLGIEVPRHLSLVGFSDRRLAQWAQPQLTTIHQPFEELGASVTRLLIDRIEHTRSAENAVPDDSLLELSLPTRLLHRESTAVPSDV